MINSIQFNNYKGFKNETNYLIENIGKVNVFIGKNNSGKSSILDIIHGLYDSMNKSNRNDYKLDFSDIVFSAKITEDIFMDFDKKDIGELTSQEFKFNLKKVRLSEKYQPIYIADMNSAFNTSVVKVIEENISSGIQKYSTFRSNSNINIRLESTSAPQDISGNGSGVSYLLGKYAIQSGMDDQLVKTTLLSALNSITMPDYEYEEICLKISENMYEISLREKNHDLVPLKDCGQGLQTILFILVCTIFLPRQKDYEDKIVILIFEELENNLHPFLQRKIFSYIEKIAKSNKMIFFLSSQSNVAIDVFAKSDISSIYHVYKEHQIPKISSVKTFIDKINILNDLDFKASDLLQANCIIWVEGPSDRIYINKWMSLIESNLQEDVHYQFLYYNGRLLAHYSANTSDELTDLINIFKVNTNAYIVMDSDKKSEHDKINNTKMKVLEQIGQNNCFITAGKEVENYLDPIKLNGLLNLSLKTIEPYDVLFDPENGKLKDYKYKKVDVAKKMSKLIEKEDLEILGLKNDIKKIIHFIKKANKQT